MRVRTWTRDFAVVSALGLVVVCGGAVFASPADARTVVRIALSGGAGWQRQAAPPIYLQPPVRPRPPFERRGVYQEPATARGYADGYNRGLDDGRKRERYDPVGEKAYRDGDQGYYSSYGSRDAYKNNYRAGFRQGYEEGYRAGTRGRR